MLQSLYNDCQRREESQEEGGRDEDQGKKNNSLNMISNTKTFFTFHIQTSMSTV